MKKKPPDGSLKKPPTKPTPDNYADREWHNGGDIEIHAYADSLRQAAGSLLDKIQSQGADPRTDYDACPVILLYRQSLELHLKMLVGEGSRFLKSPTDPITLAQTHSLRWLAQIVVQIIKAVGLENEFMFEGRSSLSEFNILVNDIEALEPVTRVIRSAKLVDPEAVTKFYRAFDIIGFGKRMDALLDLLSVTTDGLAAIGDAQQAGARNEKLLEGLKGGDTVH